MGELREGTRGGYEGAILAPKLVQTDLGTNRSLRAVVLLTLVSRRSEARVRTDC